MALSKLIESSIKCNAELVAAVADGKDYETIKKIDENLLFLISSIRDLHVFSLHDINRQMKFFLHRSTDFDDATSSSFDIEALNCLVDRYTDAKGDLPKIGQTEKTISAQAAINLRNHKFLSDELLQEPNSRVALFNTDYIYEYSSNANARFNNAKPEDMSVNTWQKLWAGTASKTEQSAILISALAESAKNTATSSSIPTMANVS